MTIRDSLAQVQELLGRATPGKWCVATCYQKANEWPVVRDIAGKMTIEAYSYNKPEDCAAIAAAVNFLRTHIPALLAMMEDRDGR